jgi:predicted RNA-binding protein YlqC (UPF0109 family)
MQLTELVEVMVRAMVDDPESVDVREIGGEQSSLIELRVAKSNLGSVIGKQGRNAHALRTILGAAAAKIKKRALLDIIE